MSYRFDFVQEGAPITRSSSTPNATCNNICAGMPCMDVPSGVSINLPLPSVEEAGLMDATSNLGISPAGPEPADPGCDIDPSCPCSTPNPIGNVSTNTAVATSKALRPKPSVNSDLCAMI